jgi:hypothetical protein
MNSIIDVCGKHALFHRVKNAEFTGVYDKFTYDLTHLTGDNYNHSIAARYLEVGGKSELIIEREDHTVEHCDDDIHPETRHTVNKQ